MPIPNPNAPTKETLYHDYFAEKIPVNDLAKKYGYAHNSAIYDLLTRYGMKSRGYNTPSKEVIETLYIKEDLSLKAIADKLNIQPCTVDALIRKYGIPRRGKAAKPIQKQHMTEEQLQIVRGTLLGDGYMWIPGTSKYPQLQVDHGIRQREYTEWLHTKLAPFSGKLSTRIVKQHRIKGVLLKSDKEAIRFKSCCHPDFTPIYDLYYPNGKKTITTEVLSHITELGLAVWYMDDGVSSNYKALELCTGLDKDTQDIILLWFETRFKLKARYRYTTNGGYRVKFIGDDALKLANIIAPYFTSSMMYKIQSLI